MHDKGPGQALDPNDLVFGVVLKLAHAEPGQSCAPDDFTTCLGVAGSFTPLAVPSSELLPADGLGVAGSFASSVGSGILLPRADTDLAYADAESALLFSRRGAPVRAS